MGQMGLQGKWTEPVVTKCVAGFPCFLCPCPCRPNQAGRRGLEAGGKLRECVCRFMNS